jgi:hypothetical protein
MPLASATWIHGSFLETALVASNNDVARLVTLVVFIGAIVSSLFAVDQETASFRSAALKPFVKTKAPPHTARPLLQMLLALTRPVIYASCF